MKTKYIGFAYPTSDIAREAGYPATGCWFLKVFIDHKYNDELVYVSHEKESVLFYADHINVNEWANYSMHEDKYK